MTVDNDDDEGKLLSRTRWTPGSQTTKSKHVGCVKELPNRFL